MSSDGRQRFLLGWRAASPGELWRRGGGPNGAEQAVELYALSVRYGCLRGGHGLSYSNGSRIDATYTCDAGVLQDIDLHLRRRRQLAWRLGRQHRRPRQRHLGAALRQTDGNCPPPIGSPLMQRAPAARRRTSRSSTSWKTSRRRWRLHVEAGVAADVAGECDGRQPAGVAADQQPRFAGGLPHTVNKGYEPIDTSQH